MARPVVLVHGAWGGAWVWKTVARRLRAEGLEVYAPTLSGVADRAHIPPDVVTLETHVEDVAALLRYEDLQDVLLVGHSYGGMPITGAADREIGRIGAMVYLDAFLPVSGQSAWDVAGPEAAERHRVAAEAHDGGRTLPYHLGQPPAADAARAYTPQPLRTLSQPWTSVRETQDWPPRVYVRFLRTPGPIFHRTAAALEGVEGWTLETLDAAHDAPQTHPDQVMELLLRYAGLPEQEASPRKGDGAVRQTAYSAS